MEHEIRFSEMSDYGALVEWLKDPEQLHWFPMSTDAEIEEAAKNWIGFSRYRASLTASVEGKAVGIATLFLMPYRKVSHFAQLYMLVDPALLGKGIGTSLLRNAINLAQNYFRLESVLLEIYEGSPLQPLAEKLSFTVIANQEGYVHEDGTYLRRILLERELKVGQEIPHH